MIGLRCYVCGKPIPDRALLVGTTADTDRVFVVGEECRKLLDEEGVAVIIQVEEGWKRS